MACYGIGYKGQVPIIEFVRFRTPEDFMAFKNGDLPYYSFQDDARAKVLSGVTDCSEISRASGGDLRLCDGADCVVEGWGMCHRRKVEAPL